MVQDIRDVHHSQAGRQPGLCTTSSLMPLRQHPFPFYRTMQNIATPQTLTTSLLYSPTQCSLWQPLSLPVLDVLVVLSAKFITVGNIWARSTWKMVSQNFPEKAATGSFRKLDSQSHFKYLGICLLQTPRTIRLGFSHSHLKRLLCPFLMLTRGLPLSLYFRSSTIYSLPTRSLWLIADPTVQQLSNI